MAIAPNESVVFNDLYVEYMAILVFIYTQKHSSFKSFICDLGDL